MDALRGAAALARLLLVVAETRRDGELWLEQPGRRVRLSLREGQLCGVQGLPLQPLGDLLRELDALDGARASALCASTLNARAAKENGLDVPIGLRLIAAGATSWSAVRRALALQRARAVAELLRMPVVRTWQADRTPLRGGAVAVELEGAVWDAMLAMAGRLPSQQRAQLAHQGKALALSVAGRRRARGQVERALACDSDQLALRAVLCALGLAAPAGMREDSYALLLRKRGELARNASARALLDLPGSANAAGAQRALRKLATKLHPDRFQADDARLQQVSHEVMGALTRAASSLHAAVRSARSM
jgi:hypothetical protein